MLKNDRELANTKEKLSRLEDLYAKLLTKPYKSSVLRSAELSSLKKTINQFTEEIVRYEAHRGVRREAAQPSVASASSNPIPS